MKKFIQWGVLFLILNLIDFYTTMGATNVGAVEINSIAHFFVENESLMFYKLSGLLVLYLVLRRIVHKSQADLPKVVRILQYGCIFYSIIVLNNFLVWQLMV